MPILFDQFGRPIESSALRSPDTRQISVAQLRDRWSTYPSNGLTPVRLAQILKSADNGDVLRQAELFEEMEEKDAHLASQFQTRKLAVQGLDWQITPGGESARAKEITKFCTEFIEGFTDFDDYLLDILDALPKGYSLSEIIWEASSGEARIQDVKWVHAKKVTFWNSITPRVLTEDAPAHGEDLAPYKWIYHRYKARSGYDTRAGIMRVCAWMYLFKNYDVKDWVGFAEVFGKPLRLGKYDSGSSVQDREALANAVRSLGSDAAGIISKATEIEFVQASVSGSLNIYETLARFCDDQMSKAILGQILTSEASGQSGAGSRALGSVHNEVRHDLTEADAKSVSKTITRQMLHPLVGFNYGFDAPMPVFTLISEEPEDMEVTSRVYQVVSDLIDISQEHVSERFKIPLMQAGETPLRRVASPLQASGPPDQPGSVIGAKNRLPRLDTGLTRHVLKTDIQAPGENFENDQRVLDDVAARGIDTASGDIKSVRGLIMGWLMGATSLQAAADGIYGLYPALDISGLAAALSPAMESARAFGRDSIGMESTAAKAFWGPGTPFSEAIDYFNAKAFTISGVTHAELLSAIKQEIVSAIETGALLDDFRKSVDTLFTRYGFDPLHPFRIETIFRTNVQVAYQGGRYRQMIEPAVAASLPYWRYVAVMDGSTRPEHAALHGKIYRFDHEFWKTWYPPNGFRCRCTVSAVSDRTMRKNGWQEETEDITGTLIEPIDPATGIRMPARPLMPDPGWRYNPAETVWVPDMSRYDTELADLINAKIGDQLEALRAGS